MLKITKCLAGLRRLPVLVGTVARKVSLGQARLWWPVFILILTAGIFTVAVSSLTLLSAVGLVAALSALGWTARQWPAMQISVLVITLVYLCMDLTDTTRQLQGAMMLTLAVLLVTVLLVAVVVESGKSPLTLRHTGLAGWLVIISGVLAILLDWSTRLTTELYYAGLPFSHVDQVLLWAVVMMVFLYLLFLRTQTRLPGSFVALLPAVLFGLFLCGRYFAHDLMQRDAPSPVVEHGLLLVHVPAMTLAFALLMSCGGFALVRLLSDTPWLRQRRNIDILETMQIGLDDYLYRLLMVAIMLLGVGLLSGMLWADLAWGHYWQWQPKQAMTMGCWFYYLAGLHLHLQKGMQVRPFAWWCVAGLMMPVLILIGTNLWPQGLHMFGTL